MKKTILLLLVFINMLALELNAIIINPPPENNLTYFASKTGTSRGFETLIQINPSDNTKFDRLAASGFIITNDLDSGLPRKQLVEWGSEIGIFAEFVTSAIRTSIFVDRNGATFQTRKNPNIDEFKDLIFLGVLAHSNQTIIESAVNLPDMAYNNNTNPMADNLGIIIGDGMIVEPNLDGTFRMTTGNAFGSARNYDTDRYYPDVKANDLLNPLVLLIGKRAETGSATQIIGVGVTLNTTQYDKDGILTEIPDEAPWTFSPIFYAITLQLGGQFLPQKTYQTYQEALNAARSRNFRNLLEVDLNMINANIIYKKGDTVTDPDNFLIAHESSIYRYLGEEQSSYDFFDNKEIAGSNLILKPQDDLLDVLTVTGSSYIASSNLEEIKVYNGEEYRKITVEPDKVLLRLSGDQSIPKDTWTTVNFGLAPINDDGMADLNISSSNITIQRKGVYGGPFAAAFDYQLNAEFILEARKNSSTVIGRTCVSVGAGLISEVCKTLAILPSELDIGDILTMHVYHNANTSIDLNNSYKTGVYIRQEE